MTFDYQALAAACRSERERFDLEIKNNETTFFYYMALLHFWFSQSLTKVDDYFKRHLGLRQFLGRLGLRHVAVFLRSMGWIP